MSRCVLVAESDPTELELIATVLARDGFRVLQALEREQAMSLFAGDDVPLVIAASDVSGRGGGAAMCAEVKKQKPSTRFIILHPSGNDPDARTVLLSRTGCDAVLPSPFRYDALKRLLADWGFAPGKPAAAAMSFAVPAPDVVDLVAPPSVEALVPEPAAPVVAEGGGPIPIPVVMPVPGAMEDEPTVDRRAPVGDELIADGPTSDVPIADQPIADGPITDGPITDVPIADGAIADVPIADGAIADVPIADQPIADGAIADVPIADQPIADVPITDVPIADQPIADEPIADEPIADVPIADEPIADEPIADEPIADEPLAEQAIADAPIAASAPPVAPQSVPQGDWLLAPPSEDSARDGFAGLDFGSNIDTALDTALGNAPTARFEALPDDAARSVALAVQAYVADSLALGDAPEPPSPPAPSAAPEPAPALAPPPELPPIEALADEPAAVLPPELPPEPPASSAGDTETVEIPPTTWEVTEPGAAQSDSIRPAGLDAYRDSASAAWEVDEPRSLAPPMSTIAEQVAAGEPATTPPPVEEAAPVAASPPPPPLEAAAEPPPPPLEAVSGVSQWKAPAASTSPPPPPPPAESVAPPPPPREALHEPPALPFEAIGPRNPVGAEPRTTLPPSVPPEGDLATMPLPRLLFELYGGTYCGTLRLSRKGADRIIDVWNGFPVAVTVTPEEEEDDVATILRDHGRITPEQHADATRRAGGRAAQLLVALGVIDERDLLDCIREQTELRLAASFSWRDGTYKITPSRAPPDSVVLSEVHPVKIIWRGVCEHYDVGSLLAFFSPLRARFIVATEVFPIHYESLGPFLRSVGVAHLLDGKTTFEQALRSDDSHALTIAHTLYVLIVTEMIRAQSKPGEAAKFPEAQGQARPSKPVDYRELTRACEEVARTYLALKGRDYFAMLELERQASENEVLAAYERLAKPFKVENLLPGLPDDVQRRAREIDNLLRRARDTLSSPEERRRYLNRLEENQPPPPPADALAS